jgi:hypothetical protein
MPYAGDPAGHASSDNLTLYKVTLQNSPQFNLYAMSNGLTVWGVKIVNPGGAPNTDGIDPSGSTDVTIRDSYISTGDDHIAIKGGIRHVANVTITHNHLYYGHGLSIGSETNAGIENVLAGNSSTFKGYDASRALTVFMDNVVWDAFNSRDFTSSYTGDAVFTLGPNPVDFAGTLIQRAQDDLNVTVNDNTGTGDAPYDCTGRFI